MTRDDLDSGGVRAAEVFDVELRPRQGGPLLRGLRLVVAVAAQMFGGLITGPALSDLVVVRRADRAEVARTATGGVEGTDLLDHVRAAAHEQSVEQFLARWGPARRTSGR